MNVFGVVNDLNRLKKAIWPRFRFFKIIMIFFLVAEKLIDWSSLETYSIQSSTISSFNKFRLYCF